MKNPFTIVFLWALSALAAVPAIPRAVMAAADFIAIYPQPADTLPPVRMASKGQIFPLLGSRADDSGQVWFCLALSAAKKDTGFVPAQWMRYAPQSADSLAKLTRNADDKEDQKRRYALLRKHADWPRRIRNAIRNGEITLDMTEDQLEASWGKPERSAHAFMVGVGQYAVWFYKISVNRPPIAVMILDEKVAGWTEE